MTTRGTLKANALQLGKLEVNWLQSPMKLGVLAALVNTERGSTHAWLDGSGVQWSKETTEALNHLRTCIEADLANVHFEGGAEAGPVDATGLRLPTGVGEFLGTVDEVPSV